VRIRSFSNITITLILVMVLGLWMFSGFLLPSGGSDAKTPDQAGVSMDKLFTVRVAPSTATEQERDVVFYGVTEADRLVNMTADVEGKVERLLVKEGAKVNKGQKLVALEIKERGAKLAQSKSFVEQRQIEYDAALQLQEKGLASNMMIAERKAKLEEAKAALIQTRLALQRSSIVAPFTGTVERIDVEEGELINSRDKMVLQIVDREPLVVRGHVTEFDIAWLAEGQEAQVLLADGREFTGKVRFVGVVGDDVTRTFRVEAMVPNEDGKVPAGVTATVRILVGTVKAHTVPSSVLELNPEGEMGVKGVDEDNKITFHPVEIVKETPNGMMVAGLPEQLKLVTLGGPFVNIGEKVNIAEQPPRTDKQ